MCSTGFYTLVAIPAFADTRVGTTHHVGSITMYCYDMAGRIDGIGASVNATIFFRLSNTIDKSSAGGVTIHLHHTVRRVQVQGSSMVTDHSRASVWFVENYLLGRFTAESQNKSFDISRFNTAVNKLVSNHAEKINAMEKCELCAGHFNGRSIREQCNGCTKSFHKKCIQSVAHPCMVPSALAPLSRPETSSGHRHPMMHPTLQPIPNIATMPDNSEGSLDPIRPSLPTLSLPMVPVHDHDGNSDDSTHATDSASEQPSVDYTPANISTSTITPVIRVLDPTLPPYTPLPRPSTERLSKGKTKPKSGVATSKEDIALEFSKIEVNTICARLKVLETKNKDLEFQNSLLLERVAVYERAEKEAIYEKYFPKPNSVPATNRSDHLPPPHHLCHSVPLLSVAVRDTSVANQYQDVIRLFQPQLLQQPTRWILFSKTFLKLNVTCPTSKPSLTNLSAQFHSHLRLVQCMVRRKMQQMQVIVTWSQMVRLVHHLNKNLIMKMMTR